MSDKLGHLKPSYFKGHIDSIFHEEFNKYFRTITLQNSFRFLPLKQPESKAIELIFSAKRLLRKIS